MAKKRSVVPANLSESVGPFKQVETVNLGADVPTLYSNNINIEVSSFDVRLRIGQIQGVSGEGNLKVKDVAYLFMSHQHFMALAEVMSTTLEKVKEIQRTSDKK